MQDKLIDIKNEAVAQILAAKDARELEDIRVEYLGKSAGKLTLLIKKLPGLPPEEKAIVGQFANEVKQTIEETLQAQKKAIQKEKEANIAETEKIDVTLPAVFPPEGHLHPITKTLKEVYEVFKFMGYQMITGPEIETDEYNFTRVNMPKDAPSRDAQASFYLDTRNSKIYPGEYLLRTQTSNMQSRALERIRPPFRVFSPGKCFRVDDVDASHGFEFWQFEGILIDKNITVTNLLGTLDFILKSLLPGTEVRFKSGHFGFTEPSIEAMIRCTICGGRGCPYCKNLGWSEILGSGMTHPNVYKAAGIDPRGWTGFAFGMGLSRLALLKNQIDDLRVLTNSDLRILKQF
ncbi:MAG: phenylalanine--tRNA ligase subunit alpha [Patescibacteria group bacterium]|nr:phenylalanine--tRNA ligase subunit alpha [Patescibacteria group bacterium]MCL5432066.1 phenylalanine--tRNA ligase subunit alpha [Patescibacteria group bacterium]